MGWQPREAVPAPVIQLEAADELLRMEYQLTLQENFLINKKAVCGVCIMGRVIS
jgi:hypothetical protein